MDGLCSCSGGSALGSSVSLTPGRYRGSVQTKVWVLAVVLLAAAAGCSSPAQPKAAVTTRAATTTIALQPGASGGAAPTDPNSTTTTGTPLARPRTLVAVTTAGAVQVLDAGTGQPLRTLATGATGPEIGVSPDGGLAFYETPVGCTHQINRVATAGGTTTIIAPGSLPTVSPDGTLLAFARQPHVTANSNTCQGPDATAANFAVIVRSLTTGAETRFPLPPAVVAGGLPLPIGHLSWGPDSHRLAVSISGGQDNEQWSVMVIDRTRDKFYVPTPSAPVPAIGPKGTYLREAVFTANGALFVDRECCTGIPPKVTSSVLATIDPGTGATRQQLAIGVATRDHTSLDVDGTGHWLLYLAGPDLLISQDGARPATLASGFQAADW